MMGANRCCWILCVVGAVTAYAPPAFAIPALARKYGTSCQTCHVIYPKLTPFGEAFRRNGYRFPDVDSDYVKEATVPMGQQAQRRLFPDTVWPGTLPSVPGLAFGADGTVVTHPQKDATAARADHEAGVSLQDTVAEGHVWAAGSIDDTITLWGELTVSTEGEAELEHARVLLNDIVGPSHMVNVTVGRGPATLSSFGPHSSYLADSAMPSVPVTALYGASSDSWSPAEHYNGVELNGTIGGRVDYALGANAGANLDVRPAQAYYGHVGVKLGGLRLDGEGKAGPADAMRPWAETAVTLYGFAYEAGSRYLNGLGEAQSDTAFAAGGGLRAQIGSLEINGAAYRDHHEHATVGAGEVTATVQSYEASYVAWPWLVPAARVEVISLAATNAKTVSDIHIELGAAALIRPNLKAVVVGHVERAKGMPAAGWAPAGLMVVPSSPVATVSPELESITASLAWAF